MYRIMIVDDEPLILAGIASLLNWGGTSVPDCGKGIERAAGSGSFGYGCGRTS